MNCPDPGNCPVARPDVPKHLRSHVIKAGTSWFNVSRHAEVFNSTGVGDSRFSPLPATDGQPIPHIYLAQNHVGALLESALHDVWGATATIQRTDLRGRCLRRVTCLTDLRVIDLRDDQLDHYGIGREQLIASPPEHYACTRRWAQQRAQASIGGQPTAGFIWHSRQVEVAADHAREPMRILLAIVEQAGHTAIIYDSNGRGHDWFNTDIVHADLSVGNGLAFVTELAVALGLHVED